jgi:hypothetical protein
MNDQVVVLLRVVVVIMIIETDGGKSLASFCYLRRQSKTFT